MFRLILLDRLFKIKTDGFDNKSKTTIAKDYLVPRLMKEYNIAEEKVTFSDESILAIIDHYTDKEKGVRNLKRCLETIISKINVLQYLIAAENKVDKPLYLDNKKVEKKLNKKKTKPKKKDNIELDIKLKKKKTKTKSLPKSTKKTYYE